MNRRLLPLSQLRAFEAAARHRSFKQAAEELAVTPAAISHQVRELEALLGVALFERRIRQVVPTPAAEHLFPVLQRGFDAFGDALEALREQGNGSSVTLSCTPAFASQWLLPRLADFHLHCPDIDLRIHASEAPLELSRGASLAIRYGMGPYPEHEAEVLAEDSFALVASPQLGLASYEDLRTVRHIVFDWYSPALGLRRGSTGARRRGAILRPGCEPDLFRREPCHPGCHRRPGSGAAERDLGEGGARTRRTEGTFRAKAAGAALSTGSAWPLRWPRCPRTGSRMAAGGLCRSGCNELNVLHGARFHARTCRVGQDRASCETCRHDSSRDVDPAPLMERQR
ncbi:hypothetical protein Q427_20750 [Halomonas sp. BC04]|nr:LysR family transcriptional regulator [Halomonas sp. BC04]EWH00178.1 hypothetical protein Q427_20750 [Halomonas sp. BC04]